MPVKPGSQFQIIQCVSEGLRSCRTKPGFFFLCVWSCVEYTEVEGDVDLPRLGQQSVRNKTSGKTNKGMADEHTQRRCVKTPLQIPL